MGEDVNSRRGLTFDDVLLVPAYCGMRTRKAPTTTTELGWIPFDIPIISANMDTITGVEMAVRMSALGGLGIMHRFCSVKENVKWFTQAADQIDASGWVGVSVGVTEQEWERAEALISAGADIVCVDVAHGHAKMVGKMVKRLRDRMGRAKFSKSVAAGEGIIIAGNVATYAGADYLASCGADVIKVGIGPGSVCTTRIKTGFGVPQLTAIMDCARGSKPIIADGGMRTPGDVVKALAAGASMVMLGGMLAATDETPGDVSFGTKGFRGMASKEAQDEFMGGMDDWKTAEGIAVALPKQGPVEAVIRDVIGGLRSGMTYAGASTLAELRRRVEFIEVTPSAVEEGKPHVMRRY
jgi:IMP dehydrogenase